MEVRNLRILVADDHASMRDCIVSLLQADFEVVGAVSDGDELVKAALELKPDVIVSDICMPKLTGIDAKECLQALGVDVPFVFVSANFTEKVVRDLGVCVSKGDLVSNLNSTVRSAVSEGPIRPSDSDVACGVIADFNL
jgi:DNA-binding NarL/FixJ family response regulator